MCFSLSFYLDARPAPLLLIGGECENVSQPRWSVNSECPTLIYLSDKEKGWWNIHKIEINTENADLNNDIAPLSLIISPVLLCEGGECLEF